MKSSRTSMTEADLCVLSRGIIMNHDREVRLSNHLIFEGWVTCQNET